MMEHACYLSAHQTLSRPPTHYESLLADALCAAFGSGVEDLAGLVRHLAEHGPSAPFAEGWTESNLRQELDRLAAI
ncbi:MAG: hypothetical protein QHC78_15245 [Pigmentiphaga sp.]|uniref:recombinase-like helix-turn-helix domain-containing protein n=1 Tax=Pigmentiphaga sp. TaxID=1977564 RepID=UPI0029B63536|nr:recombinase-like helix-turn-helix domain-containing protein [Pigmentiphaga sp.]MDX3907041.1 hypothetical protein [Pigmentiphaga sp.]